MRDSPPQQQGETRSRLKHIIAQFPEKSKNGIGRLAGAEDFSPIRPFGEAGKRRFCAGSQRRKNR
ncbi:MAG: hypothetical protein II779_00770, partial [Clostridia bacterium]|nr:hypothetical protein [Clostridia bacterium]